MIDGFCNPKFDAVKAAFDANFTQGTDLGASVAVIHRGEVVVDLWGGHTDATKSTEWGRDTLINVWSTTKTMTALCMLILMDRSELDPDAPVAKYWPEFEANGKGNVLIRHIMSHTAGLPGWDEKIDVSVLFDWDRACALLAAQPTWWEPGTASGYHATSQGFLCGEVVRRVTGLTLGHFFAREVAGPTGADFHIGTSQAQDHRVISVIPPEPTAGFAGLPADAVIPPEFEIAHRTFTNPQTQAEVSFTIPWRRAELPAVGGHGNARSVAVAQHAVSHGGLAFGRRILSPNATDVIFREQHTGIDRVLFSPLHHGIGYALPGELRPLPSARAVWWAGWGGSLCVNDLDEGFTFAYVMNRMLPGTFGDQRSSGLLTALYRSLG